MIGPNDKGCHGNIIYQHIIWRTNKFDSAKLKRTLNSISKCNKGNKSRRAD